MSYQRPIRLYILVLFLLFAIVINVADGLVTTPRNSEIKVDRTTCPQSNPLSKEDTKIIKEQITQKRNIIAKGDENDKSQNISGLSRRTFLASTALLSSSVMMAEPTKAEESLSSSSSSSLSVSSTASATTSTSPTTFQEVMAKASKKAISGGKAGASASIVQVLSLMWLRTSMNYQYRYGGTLNSSLETLYKEGGIPRLYQGLPFALVQGPMTR